MQEPQSSLQPGVRVFARGEPWHVTRVTAYAHCEAVDLRGAGATNYGSCRTLLSPFDRLRQDTGERRPRLVSMARWMHAFRTLAAHAAPADALWMAAAASVDLFAYQLEPALALVRGLGARLLIADEVGLGKTIQAGLALAELRARGRADHVLVLTPAGLRDQWASELAIRFGIDTDLVDSQFLARACARLPPDVNPWLTTRTSIASIDYVKRPEVLQAMEPVVWDVLIVDEAHGVAGDSDRAAAVRLLSARARHVLLLTATPHDGDEHAFAALCNIGRFGESEDPLLWFRRTRADVGCAASYRARLVKVALTPAERQMHDLLDAYCRKVWAETQAADARLAMVVLKKRALSGAGALVDSVERRLAWLSQTSVPMPEQLSLLDAAEADALDEDRPPDLVVGARGLSNAAHERAWLGAIADAARRAMHRDSKTEALCRALRRTREPAIVFTEYRDTLTRLAAALAPIATTVLLHGGLSRRERLAAEERFTSGAARVLLATDAAGQGLNLHARCRWVINVELPWSPTRLEQRIGRVHRIGQHRRVHAMHLFAADTAESTVLAKLAARLDRVRASLGNVDDVLGVWAESQVAEAVMRNDPALLRAAAVQRQPDSRGVRLQPDLCADGVRLKADATRGTAPSAELPPGVRRLDLTREAADELERLIQIRRMNVRHSTQTFDGSERPALWVSAPRRLAAARIAQHGGPAAIVVVRTFIADGSGQQLETCVVGVLVELAGTLCVRRSADLRDVDHVLRQARDAALIAARRKVAIRVIALQDERAPALLRAIARERAIIADQSARLAARLIQPGLFDRHEHTAAPGGDCRAGLYGPPNRRPVKGRPTGAASDAERRIARLEAALTVESGDPEVVLALLQ